jgi:hypothetical protein
MLSLMRIQGLQDTFLLAVAFDDLKRYVEDGCLFYKFILTGWEKLEERHRDKEEAKHCVIAVRLGDDAVEIFASTNDIWTTAGPGMSGGHKALHRCVFGVFAGKGQSVATERAATIVKSFTRYIRSPCYEICLHSQS